MDDSTSVLLLLITAFLHSTSAFPVSYFGGSPMASAVNHVNIGIVSHPRYVPAVFPLAQPLYPYLMFPGFPSTASGGRTIEHVYAREMGHIRDSSFHSMFTYPYLMRTKMAKLFNKKAAAKKTR